MNPKYNNILCANENRLFHDMYFKMRNPFFHYYCSVRTYYYHMFIARIKGEHQESTANNICKLIKKCDNYYRFFFFLILSYNEYFENTHY